MKRLFALLLCILLISSCAHDTSDSMKTIILDQLAQAVK